MTPLNIQIDSHDKAQQRIVIQGEINIHTAPQLRDAFLPIFAINPASITVDLSDVPFMDSSGIATLVEGLQWSRTCGGKFILSGMTEAVRDLFGLAKLDTVFTIV
ncbi:MAG: STAS domain-containing protein [Mariprofundales bacterium]